MDPVSIGFIVWVGEKIASAVMRENAKSKRREAEQHYNSSRSRLEAAQSDHRAQALAAFEATNQLGVRRTKEARRILGRVKRSAKLVQPKSAFDPGAGWFGGKDESSIDKLVGVVRALDTKIQGVAGMDASGAALIVAMGLDQLEKAFPNVMDMNIHDAIASIPLDHSADWADALGTMGDIGMSDLVAGLSVLLSAASLYTASKEADKVRTQARGLLENAEKLEADARRNAAITTRATAINTALSDLSYPAFKQAWVAEQIQRGPKIRALRDHHAAHLKTFERTARRFWLAMSIPVVDAQGRADTLPAFNLAAA